MLTIWLILRIVELLNIIFEVIIGVIVYCYISTTEGYVVLGFSSLHSICEIYGWNITKSMYLKDSLQNNVTLSVINQEDKVWFAGGPRFIHKFIPMHGGGEFPPFEGWCSPAVIFNIPDQGCNSVRPLFRIFIVSTCTIPPSPEIILPIPYPHHSSLPSIFRKNWSLA